MGKPVNGAVNGKIVPSEGRMRRSWWGPIGFVALNLLLLSAWVAVQVQARQERRSEPGPPPAVSQPAERPAPKVWLAKTRPLDNDRPRNGG